MSVSASRSATLARSMRVVAGFDLLVTGCLALPPFARVCVPWLFAGAGLLGQGSLRGELEPLHWLFVNLAGVLGVLWALVRLRTPTPELALLDVGGRFAVAALILHATAAAGMTPLLHFFVTTELGGAVAQYWAVRRLQREAVPPATLAVPGESGLQIRAFEERDLEALVALLLAVFPDPAPHNEPRASIERKLGVDRELLLVGHAGGRLVATAMGGWDGHRGWLYQVAVAADARGRGHGRAIVAAAEARLRARGCAKLNLQAVASNDLAVGFWRRLGYRVEERVSLGKLLPTGERES